MCHGDVEEVRGEIMYRQCLRGRSSDGQGVTGSAGIGGVSSNVYSQ